MVTSNTVYIRTTGGHCVRHEDEVVNKLVLWQPTDGHANRGRQKITYVDNLLQDQGWEACVNCRQSWWTEGAGRVVYSTRGVLKDDLGRRCRWVGIYSSRVVVNCFKGACTKYSRLL